MARRLEEDVAFRVLAAGNFRRFSLRGLNKVQGEWDLVCLALNVKRMQGLQAA